ncbi:hypothetical protein [Thiobacter aerophilum]|uniref:DUF3375 family protein n=1 Tax=Thiobacter aerophilum TaxID=3121275 RepID=A0ABV0EC33_9BURK
MEDKLDLSAFLAPGVEAGDVPSLFPLLAGRRLIGALVALFRGGDEEVLVRLAVLREIGARAEAPEWSPRELETHLAFIDPIKLDTVLKRLREHDLLVWDGERRLYQLSPVGRMVLSALSTLLAFATDEGSELGFLASQVAAGGATGRLLSETLAHLAARLAELEEEFTQAVASGSEFRLRAAQNKLASVWRWMEKGNEIIAALSEDGFSDDASWRMAQDIGSRQSRMMRMASVFQRELAAIARQRVHLSEGGLTSSELAGWLRGLDVDRLAALASPGPAIVPEPIFVLPDVMLDNTEEFLDRTRQTRRVSVLPPPTEVRQTTEVPREPPPHLAALTRLLAQTEHALPLTDAVVGEDFSAASYRLSLLSFLGEQNVDPELAPLASLPLAVVWEEGDALVPVQRGEVAAMTPGRIEPTKRTS